MPYLQRPRSALVDLLVQGGQVSTDRHSGGLLIGVIDAKADEQVERVLPVCAGLLVLVKGLMCVSEPVVGSGLVVGLV